MAGTRIGTGAAPAGVAAAALALALAVAMLVGASAASEPAGAAPAVGDGEGRLELKSIAGFDAPVYVTRAPGRANRRLLFVVEQEGVVRVLRRNRVLRRPFLDIRPQVLAGGERGLLSIAFDPGYAKNRRLYAYFTDADGDIRVSQYRRSKRSKRRAKARARRVIEIPHRLAANHNGGTVAFGPDGHMYIGTGDGGGGCDPEGNAQDPRSLLGKLLRIDPKRRRGYRVPRDNPFVGAAPRDEIYASGLRNPFRFSFDRATGTIAIGDVGQNDWEEVDYETLASARGANFGWDAFEGAQPTPVDNCGEPSAVPSDHEPPIHQYGHDGPGHTGCAITGGVVVRDRRLPSLYGRYVYADVCTSELRSLIPDLGGAVGDRGAGVDLAGPTSFGVGRGRRLYVTSLSGALFRVVERGGFRSKRR